MLPLKYRLTKDKEIKQVFSNGNKIFGSSIIINFSKNQLPNSRFAFVVSNKTFKKAVDRNYYKRVLRSIIYSLIPSITNNTDFVIVIKKDIQNMSFENIKNECSNLFNKIK